MINNIGTGRISEIIAALISHHKVSSTRKLSPKIKLQALLFALQLSANELDSLIADNSPVFRTIKGHAFEVVFEYLVNSAGYAVTDIGGDKAVDLIVNKHKLQLKTPTIAGTKKFNVQFKTHKTHGAKSEKESMDYYHDIRHFADFLVGLISYNPLRILILNKSELPRHPKDNFKILSPFNLNWENHIGLNNFERIGVNNIQLSGDNPHIPQNLKNELLPKSSTQLNLNSNIILDTILFESNFRIWDMSIRGFSREIAVMKFLKNKNILTYYPPSVRKRDNRGNKSDFATKLKDGQYRFFQVKGVSTNNCKFSGDKLIVATETQLTRGRVNDHPTQSRLYLNSDFDFLILCLDPPIVNLYEVALSNKQKFEWKFYAIPTPSLTNHKKYAHRINAIQKFEYKDLEKFNLAKEDMLNLIKN